MKINGIGTEAAEQIKGQSDASLKGLKIRSLEKDRLLFSQNRRNFFFITKLSTQLLFKKNLIII